jgi:hypothetical protein
MSAISRKSILRQQALVTTMQANARHETHPGLKAHYQRCAERDAQHLADMQCRLKEDQSLRTKARPTNRVFPLPLRKGAP